MARSPRGVRSWIRELSATRVLTATNHGWLHLVASVEIQSQSWWEAAYGVFPGTAGNDGAGLSTRGEIFVATASKIAGKCFFETTRIGLID